MVTAPSQSAPLMVSQSPHAACTSPLVRAPPPPPSPCRAPSLMPCPLRRLSPHTAAPMLRPLPRRPLPRRPHATTSAPFSMRTPLRPHAASSHARPPPHPRRGALTRRPHAASSSPPMRASSRMRVSSHARGVLSRAPLPCGVLPHAPPHSAASHPPSPCGGLTRARDAVPFALTPWRISSLSRNTCAPHTPATLSSSSSARYCCLALARRRHPH